MRYMLMLVMVFSPAMATSELYRWQDEQGQWHFGDAASSVGKNSQTVEVAQQTQNVVNIKKLKLSKTKDTKSKNTYKVRGKKTPETLAEKKIRCEKKRDELRFQAFKHEERNQYDRECVSEMKW